MENTMVGKVIGIIFAIIVVAAVLVPFIDDATTETHTKGNENPGWLNMSYFEGSSDDFDTNVSLTSSRITVGSQNGAMEDMIIYADSNGSIVIGDGNAYLIYDDNGTVVVPLSSSFTVASSSGAVSVIDNGDTYAIGTPEWAYCPNANGKYANFNYGNLVSDGKPIAASTVFAGSVFYNDMNEFGLVMDAQTTSDTIESVKWVEDSEEQVVNPNLSPLDINLNPLNPGIGSGAIIMSADPSGATRVDDLYYTFSGTSATVAGFASGVEYGALTIPSIVVYQETTYDVVGIAGSAFRNCTSLTSVTIPSSVTSIGSSVFYGCANLTSITVESGNVNYSSDGGVLFNADKTTLIKYPQLASGSYTIPSSVTSIGSSAFSGCTALTSVIIPSSVTSIGSSAFSGCTSLTSVTIPSSVTSIGDLTFNKCTSLTSITVESGNVNYSSDGGVLFNADKTTLVTFPGGKIGQYTIPNSVTTIGNYAFPGCTALTSVIIPSSVTSIGTGAFDGCTALTSVIIPSSVTSIGVGAFSGCTSLTSVIIPSSVTTIKSNTFSGCTALTSVIIPSSVTSIGAGAFNGCDGVTILNLSSQTITNLPSTATVITELDASSIIAIKGEVVKEDVGGVEGTLLKMIPILVVLGLIMAIAGMLYFRNRNTI